MITDNLVARVVDGQITHWPYRLRPDAKKLHPEVSPLPGSWDQVIAADLMDALNAVAIYPVPRPLEPVGFDVVERPPSMVDGKLFQQWELVGEIPIPANPANRLEPFTLETVGDAADHANCVVMIVNTKRGKRPCYSDGTDWLYLSDDARVK